MSGPGFHQLNRAAFKSLGVFNKFGNSAQAARIPNNKGIHLRDRAAGLRRDSPRDRLHDAVERLDGGDLVDESEHVETQAGSAGLLGVAADGVQ